MAEPCEVWPVNEACSYDIPVDPAARSPLEEFAMQIATSQLWHLTAGIYGTCPVTVRPCGNSCRGFVYFPTQTATGIWINVTCGCEQSNCDCCYVCEIRLEGPVASITEVKIDGDIIDPDTYRVDDGYKLVRVEGECWPKCQTLALPDTEDGTFSVTYEKGLPVPFGGQRAVAALAAEIIKACEAGPCRLPSGVQEVVRQGERIQFVNGIDLLRAGLTNIPEVDAWVLSVNPRSQREVASVWSPDDLPTLRTTTWPP